MDRRQSCASQPLNFGRGLPEVFCLLLSRDLGRVNMQHVDMVSTERTVHRIQWRFTSRSKNLKNGIKGGETVLLAFSSFSL